MTEENKISKCCNAPTEIHGDAEFLVFVCTKCGEDCAIKDTIDTFVRDITRIGGWMSKGEARRRIENLIKEAVDNSTIDKVETPAKIKSRRD